MKKPEQTIAGHTARWWAELCVDNGECGAQLEIKDRELRESLIINIEKQILRIAATLSPSP